MSLLDRVPPPVPDPLVFGPRRDTQPKTVHPPGYGCIPCATRQATPGGCWNCGGDTVWTLGRHAPGAPQRAAEPVQVVTVTTHTN